MVVDQGREPGHILPPHEEAFLPELQEGDSAHIYEDRASGRLEARPGLTTTLKALRKGDTLVVWKLDRLGRGLRHLVNTVEELKGQGVGFRVLTGHGATIDTTWIYTIFSGFIFSQAGLVSLQSFFLLIYLLHCYAL